VGSPVVAEVGEEVAGVEPGDSLFSDLNRQLWAGIPLSAAAQLEVVEAGDHTVRVRAPFPPNRNYHGTVFGGSIAVSGIVSGWLTVDLAVRAIPGEFDVVIQGSEVDYLSPVFDSIEATTSAPDPADWERFRRTLERFGRARLRVESDITSDGRVVARHRGTYAALTRGA